MTPMAMSKVDMRSAVTRSAQVARLGSTVAASLVAKWRQVRRTATMLGSLMTWISSLVENASRPNQSETENCRLATAALLIRVATVGGEMSDAKLEKLHTVLKSGFELDDLATARLIDDAAAADRGAIDLYHFTRQLNDALDDEGRRVVRMMWEVIFIDRTVNEFANNIVWRAADLLGVPSRQRIALRQRIAAANARPG
jgi:uncharacterized tellurite resistance protein B-like protein